ncbi:uncharacterized protein BJ212DRAFT_1349952 [Suillus subaureus]|uniref:Uncharacterized protein n=1 Tax=Suillus subaureus TaxID=48587 RepID=A0A9P7JEB3_9AGAM|nr:uncharacterized protein BJ212DRAFT_1349952 [Suillus subaureus]KAG1817656.1 hypothetical protein BJ212DRAFT_1349952 [Suillus subaureus]
MIHVSHSGVVLFLGDEFCLLLIRDAVRLTASWEVVPNTHFSGIPSLQGTSITPSIPCKTPRSPFFLVPTVILSLTLSVNVLRPNIAPAAHSSMSQYVPIQFNALVRQTPFV